MSVILTVDTDAEAIGATLADYPGDIAQVLDAIGAACGGPGDIAGRAADVAAALGDKGKTLVRAIASRLEK